METQGTKRMYASSIYSPCTRIPPSFTCEGLQRGFGISGLGKKASQLIQPKRHPITHDGMPQDQAPPTRRRRKRCVQWRRIRSDHRPVGVAPARPSSRPLSMDAGRRLPRPLPPTLCPAFRPEAASQSPAVPFPDPPPPFTCPRGAGREPRARPTAVSHPPPPPLPPPYRAYGWKPRLPPRPAPR